MIFLIRKRLLIMTGLFLYLVIFTTQVNGRELYKHDPHSDIPTGWKLIEGDILVPISMLYAVFPDEGAFGEIIFWPEGIVPYEFDENVSQVNKDRMIEAMAVWEDAANINFVPRTEEDTSYIHIKDSDINASAVGMFSGEQVVQIHNWDKKYIIIHELGHTLGFWHEHSRYDRDEYIMMNRDNIDMNDEDFKDNFGKESKLYFHVYGPYDFDSVMHYDQYAFSLCANPESDPNNCRTVIVKPPWDVKWQDAIGQRDHLSKLDALTMSFLYPEDSWVFVNSFYELAPLCTSHYQDGTFLSPYCEFTSAAEVVPSDGTVIIQPGIYSAVGVYSNAMTLRAPLGDVTLGD
jgi:hypothetical protein